MKCKSLSRPSVFALPRLDLASDQLMKLIYREGSYLSTELKKYINDKKGNR